MSETDKYAIRPLFTCSLFLCMSSLSLSQEL